jgi:hypothetical protein
MKNHDLICTVDRGEILTVDSPGRIFRISGIGSREVRNHPTLQNAKSRYMNEVSGQLDPKECESSYLGTTIMLAFRKSGMWRKC